jgi:hypothetical protein
LKEKGTSPQKSSEKSGERSEEVASSVDSQKQRSKLEEYAVLMENMVNFLTMMTHEL